MQKEIKECELKHLVGGGEAKEGTTFETSSVHLSAFINLPWASIKEPVSSMKRLFDFTAC